MRLGRRTALLVAFSLLTSTATAYAECAWVLWKGGASYNSEPNSAETLLQAERLHWYIVSASDTLTSCQAALQKAASGEFAGLQVPYRLKQVEGAPQRTEVPSGVRMYGKTGDGSHEYHWLTCLPPGIDPKRLR